MVDFEMKFSSVLYTASFKCFLISLVFLNSMLGQFGLFITSSKSLLQASLDITSFLIGLLYVSSASILALIGKWSDLENLSSVFRLIVFEFESM